MYSLSLMSKSKNDLITTQARGSIILGSDVYLHDCSIKVYHLYVAMQALCINVVCIYTVYVTIRDWQSATLCSKKQQQ